MGFDNTLNMSILLVGAFICLHFYETSVKDEFYAHNVMLGEVVKDYKRSVDLHPKLNWNRKVCSNNDNSNFKGWRVDVEILEGLVDNPDLRNLYTSKNLFEKYNIDTKYLMHDDNISQLTQFKILEEILSQSMAVIEEFEKREKIKRLEDLKVIITNRENKYFKNETYFLNLEAVNLYKNIRHGKYHVVIDGEKQPVESFPFLLPKDAKSGLVVGSFSNPSTGEFRTIKKEFLP